MISAFIFFTVCWKKEVPITLIENKYVIAQECERHSEYVQISDIQCKIGTSLIPVVVQLFPFREGQTLQEISCREASYRQ